jgi:hypothetical protein
MSIATQGRSRFIVVLTGSPLHDVGESPEHATESVNSTIMPGVALEWQPIFYEIAARNKTETYRSRENPSTPS